MPRLPDARRGPVPPDGAPAGRAQWLLTIVGLLIAFGVPELDVVGRLGGSPAPFTLPREAVWWSLAIAMLLYVRFVERRPLVSIGLRRPTIATFAIGSGVALLLFASVIAIYAVAFPMLGLTMNRQATAGITHHTLAFQVLLALRAAFVEEILYRGYPIARIAEATGRRWIAALVSIAVFTAAHAGYWGTAQLLVIAPAAVVLALLFLWREDLVCNMTAHFLVDLAGFIAATAQSG
jgi:membrane protease YdiL (CAAX protease family)